MKTITITLRQNDPKECSSAELWEATSDYPQVTFTGPTKAGALHAVRGACLHVIGDWREVPAIIQFRSIEE